MHPSVVFITNRYSPAAEILQPCSVLSLSGIVYFPLPGSASDIRLPDFSRMHNIPLYRNFSDLVHSASSRPDFLAVYSLHKILTQAEIDYPRIAALNLHPARFPLYKGRNPWLDQFRDHVKVSGFTVHKITSDIDGGEIIAQKSFEIDYTLPLETVIEKSVRDVGGPLLCRSIIHYQCRNRPSAD